MNISVLVHYLFMIYTLMLLARIIASWVPELNRFRAMYYVHLWTEPYLEFFRRLLPPMGGFDISPILAFFSLSLLEHFIQVFIL